MKETGDVKKGGDVVNRISPRNIPLGLLFCMIWLS